MLLNAVCWLPGLTFRQRRDPVVNLRCCGNNYLGALRWCYCEDASELRDALNQNHISKHLGTGWRFQLALKEWGQSANTFTHSRSYIVLTHTRTHTHTFPGNLNQRLRWVVTLASVIDCPPRFVCLWVPVGIPPESGESMRVEHRKTISQVAAISPGT